MKIIKGKIPSAKKVVCYGPEGIGKSTFASQFPDPVFIDTEGGTKDMDVSRMEAPSSWSMLMEQVRYVKSHPDICRTLVVDTGDWAEMMCSSHVCSNNQKTSIEDFGYGKGYVYLQEEFGRLLNLLEELVKDKGINVVITAHAKMRKFEQPDELGAYDRWEMKMSKNVAPMVKEWADMLLFCNYKTIVINVDGQGTQKGKNKVQGGRRVMYTAHHSCWDAKNRYGLPEEVPFEYGQIRHIIEEGTKKQVKPEPEPAKTVAATAQAHDEMPVKSSPVTAPEKKAKSPVEAKQEHIKDKGEPLVTVDERVPKNLRDLMLANNVDEWDIQNAVAAKGYFPADMEVYDYPRNFIDGVLVGAWQKVYSMIVEMKEKEAIPFND